MSEEEENNGQQPPVKPKRVLVTVDGKSKDFDTNADAIEYLARLDGAEDPRA